ncbi:MAG: BlaI/MecI/CopY family transcriptional regulator [Clostridiales bacterium]|nr:BlaI/MecI/CopY family transcriptional regulator [Clostridiales bacterium]
MSDVKKTDISDSEWKVMQILWKKSPQTLGEIAVDLGDSVTWDKTTINTLLRRLMKKKAVSYVEARYYKYYPLVTEKECLKEEMNEILNKLFYSSPKKLMVTLVENENFTDEDLSELQKLLNNIKNRGEKDE